MTLAGDPHRPHGRHDRRDEEDVRWRGDQVPGGHRLDVPDDLTQTPQNEGRGDREPDGSFVTDCPPRSARGDQGGKARGHRPVDAFPDPCLAAGVDGREEHRQSDDRGQADDGRVVVVTLGEASMRARHRARPLEGVHDGDVGR